MVRSLVVGVGVAVMLVSCASDSGESEPVDMETVESTVASTTTAVAPSSTTVAASSTTLVPETTTTTLSYELGVWAAPADGQWFAELPIPWVSAWGWTRDEAVVTVNGAATQQEWCRGCVFQRGEVLAFRGPDREGALGGWEEGENSLVIAAAFTDGTVVEETRTFLYDPTLETFTGWMVALDEENRTITFAASTHEMGPEDGAITGPVTSVVEYPVRHDAAFILLEVDSSGQPPPTTIGFEEFADLIARAEVGDCDRCFYASSSDFFAEPDAEHGAEYFVIYLTDGEIQQLEQIWSP